MVRMHVADEDFRDRAPLEAKAAERRLEGIERRVRAQARIQKKISRLRLKQEDVDARQSPGKGEADLPSAVGRRPHLGSWRGTRHVGERSRPEGGTHHSSNAISVLGNCYAESPVRRQPLLKPLACILLVSAGLLPAELPAAQPLDCRTQAVKPYLDFEFRFLTGIVFYLPAKQFWGDPVSIDLEVLVKPVEGTSGQAVRITDTFGTRQAVPDGTKGQLHFAAAFSVGPGRYRATWRIRDGAERVCGGSRQFRAALARNERNVEVALAPGQIVDAAMSFLRPVREVSRQHLDGPRRLKIFLSMDVLGRRGRVTRPRLFHLVPLLAAARQLARSPDFNEFSLVAFSFEDQKVLLRQEYRDTIDFAPLGTVARQLRPDTVDVAQLMRGSEMEFFERMLSEELLRSQAPDAVVFVGQEMNFGQRIPARALGRIGQLGASHAFFDSSRFAWKGAMGNLVRAMKGREYRLRRPSDLAKAVQGFGGQVGRSRPQ